MNRLTVVRDSPHGLFLSDGESDVLLPRKHVPEGASVGDELDVFVLTDSEDRPLATTQVPKGMVGDVVALRAKQVGRVGAFMDWGLDKDLLVPFSEQHRRMGVGVTYVVMIRLDEATQRVYGTTRLSEHLSTSRMESPKVGDEVAIIVADVGRDAVRVVANQCTFATLFPDEIHEPLQVGDERRAYIKQIRDDGRIALSLSPQGRRAVQGLESELMDRLRAAGGVLPYGDYSPAEEIRQEFGVSKSTFKKAIGGLFKAGMIDLSDTGIRLRK